MGGGNLTGSPLPREKKPVPRRLTNAETENVGQREGREKWEEKSETKTGRWMQDWEEGGKGEPRPVGGRSRDGVHIRPGDTRPSRQLFSAIYYGLSTQAPVKVLVARSCPTLCDPMDCSLSGSSFHGILQAGILEGVAIPFPRDSSRPRD